MTHPRKYGPRCVRCGVQAQVHFRPPASCEGFVAKRAPLPVRLGCAALLDGFQLVNSIATRILKKGL